MKSEKSSANRGNSSTYLFQINEFEEFELWLEALITHHRHLALHVTPQRLAGTNRQFHAESRLSLEIIQELSALCEELREGLNQDLWEIERLISESDNAGGRAAQRTVSCKRSILELSQFLDLLRYWRTLLEVLIRTPCLGLQEFNAIGSLIEKDLTSSKDSNWFFYLKQTLSHREHHTLIQEKILSAVAQDHLKVQVKRLFLRILQLINLIQYTQAASRQGLKIPKLIILLTQCHLRTRDLFPVLEDTHQVMQHQHYELAESIPTVLAALKIEAGKAFKLELRDFDAEGSFESAYERIERALHILDNAMKQSFTLLTQAVGVEIDLFGLARERQRKDATFLLENLEQLSRFLEQGEHCAVEWNELEEALQQFRKTPLRIVFAKDRQTLVRLMDELEYADPDVRPELLQRFHIYISAIISEVRKRSVLAHHVLESRSIRIPGFLSSEEASQVACEVTASI